MEKAAQFVSQAKFQAADVADSINHDVTIMIRKRLREVQVLKHCPENTVRRVELRLIQNADRTFLWASLILELLEDSAEASEEAFDNMTTALLKRLDELYERILRTTSRPEEAKKILMLLVPAVRPLTLRELNMAFHLRESDRLREDVTYRLEPATERWIKIICGPFIRVVDSTIHLVHQTAKEFLIKPSSGVKELGGSWKHCLDPAESNTALARICIWYLFFDVFDKQPLVVNANTETDQATNAYAREHDLLDYAARYWATHFRRSDVRGHRTLLNAVFALCNTRTGRFSTWFHVYWTTISHLPALPHNLTTLMVASYLGQQEMVGKLLCEGADVTAQDSEGWSALHWAVWEGNGETWQGHEAVRPLLDAGANPEEKDNKGMTALHWAAADGQDSVVQLLIRRGASINTSDSSGWTPLHLAAANGHARVIKILVENGADIEANDENLQDVGHNA